MPAAKPVPDSSAPRPASSASLSGTTLGLVILLSVFLMIAALWAVFIPVPATSPDAPKWDGFNPDEQVHMRYLVYLATQHRFPIFTASTDWTNIYTVIHPPIYYAVGAVLYTLLSPLLGYGGTLLALRFVGCALGAGVVYLGFRTARLLLPAPFALLTAICIAGVPMFVSLSAAVSNEVAAAFCASGALYSIVAGLRYGFSRRRIYALAAWCAVGIGVKITCIALLPVALLAIWLRAAKQPVRSEPRAFSPLVASLIVVAAPFVLNGWWFIRNILVYGDPLMARVHNERWGWTLEWWKIMTPLQFFWNSSVQGWQSFWGTFDAFSRPMPEQAMAVVLGFQCLAAIGLLVFAAKHGFRPRRRRNAALCLLLFWLLVLAIFWATNWRVFAPQGRYLFPTLIPFGCATAVGWASLWGRRLRLVAVGLAAAFFLLLNFFAFAIMSVRPDKGPNKTSALPVTGGRTNLG